jgi:asparagine synthase (glutamine-hydrolysing)
VIGQQDATALLGHPLAHDPYESIANFVGEVSDCHPLDRASYVDIKTWLVDDILVKVDRASMAHGLEVRCPLLDHRVVEFAAMLPPQMKLAGFAKKHILKKSQRGRVPGFVLNRAKAGFNAPVSRWVRGPLRSYVEELVLSGPLGCMLGATAVRRMLAEHSAGRRDNGYALFALVALGIWMWQARARPATSSPSPSSYNGVGYRVARA